MLITIDTISQILRQIEQQQAETNDVFMLLFAEQHTTDIPALIENLNQKKISFFGGIFPGLIYGNQQITQGCIIKKFKAVLPPVCISGIAETQFVGFETIESAGQITGGTAIVLLDGLTPNICRFLETLNDLLGENCNFIGGGAGFISLQQQPCIFSTCGFLMDTAVVCVIEDKVRLGVRHGWAQLAGPLVATHTNGNTILQLNWQPAIDIYNRIVEQDCGIALDKDNFASIAQRYPFGILREKEDDIVRDPLAIGENGSIVCIGEVPPNTVLNVLKGHRASLLDAARSAMYDCGDQAGLPLHASGTFVVDCVTRTHYLDEQFGEEMDIVRDNLVIKNSEQEPYGVLSLGEISSYGEGLLELFNKTIVIGAFY